MLRMLTFFFSEVIRIIDDYGGTVEKNTGDGLMAYFVSPPGEKASTQQIAVAAALTIFYAADSIINPHIQASGLTKFDFRICIDHGAITVADVGVPRGFRGIVAIGTTANVASKMLAVAEANTLLLGDQVLKGLPSSWTQYAKVKTANTGWIYRSTGQPYPFWEYLGRWKANENG
jgi:class 3 adenylate cyclase